MTATRKPGEAVYQWIIDEVGVHGRRMIDNSDGRFPGGASEMPYLEILVQEVEEKFGKGSVERAVKYSRSKAGYTHPTLYVAYTRIAEEKDVYRGDGSPKIGQYLTCRREGDAQPGDKVRIHYRQIG